MPLLKVMNVTDAMILGLASKNPGAAKRHLKRLSKPEYKSAARFFVEGEGDMEAYQRSKPLVDSMIVFSGKKVSKPKRTTGKVKLAELAE